MNVYQVKIGAADATQSRERNQTIYVLASSIEDAAEKGAEFLRHDYESVPEQAEDYAVISVHRMLHIDWPLDPEE